MSGFDNEVVYAIGERLEPSTAQAIGLMQKTANDVSIMNISGSPEGVASANPSSLAHDRTSGNLYLKQTGTGNTGWVLIGIVASNTLTTIYNVSDSPAVWTKNARTKRVEVYGNAGGAGGGSGRKGTSASSGGGGPGGSGGSFYVSGPASVFNTTETVIIGAGGSGGLSQSSNATNGNPGSPGLNTSFGNISCQGGDLGLGGNTSSAFGGLNRVSFCMGGSTVLTTQVAGSNAVGSPGTNISVFLGNFLGGTQGGGGGGANIVTQRAGGVGGALLDSSGGVLIASATAGLESTGINGGNGNPGFVSTGGLLSGGGGGGGGGGYSVGASGATAGGNGGNGGFPSGSGAGGGGGIDSVANSGAGGNGANGRVIVIEYF
jgi:hypothetical protein